MKQTKKLFALLLIICMVLAMVPAVSAAEVTTVEYHFNLQDYGMVPAGNDVTGEKFAKSMNGWYNPGEGQSKQVNWLYKDSSLSTNYGTGGVVMIPQDAAQKSHIHVRSAVGDWVAFTIDNPGEGKWSVNVESLKTRPGAKKVEFYILPDDGADIGAQLTETSKYYIGYIDCYNSSPSSDRPTAANITKFVTALNDWDAGDDATYILVMKAAQQHGYNKDVTYKLNDGNDTATPAAAMYLSQITMKPIVATSELDGVKTKYESVEALETAISNATSDTEIKLHADVTIADFTLNSGVKLNLNGKTLNATVNDAAGQIIDSSGGAGRVKGATLGNLATDQMVLTDKDGYLHICDYTLSLPSAFDAVEAAEDSVRFWFDVRFDNAAVYDVIAGGNSGFSVGANFQWNDNIPVKADFHTDLSLEDWASKMKSNPNYSFYVDVTGLKNAAANGTLTVLPTVSGNQGSGSITSGLTHTVSAAQ